MKICKTIYLFSLFSIFIIYANAQLVDPVNIMKLKNVEGEIVVDGYDDECGWGDAVDLGDSFMKPDNFGGEKDLGGYFRINSDRSSIYVFAHVLDDTAIVWDGGDYGWEYDNVEVFFNFDTTGVSTSGLYAPDGIQIRFYRGADTIVNDLGWGNAEVAKIPFPNEYKIVSKKVETDEGWNVEAAIPWLYLVPSGVLDFEVNEYTNAANFIGFDIMFCDTDHPVIENGSAEARIVWDMDGGDGTEFNAWQDTRVLGLLDYRNSMESNGNCTVRIENYASSQISIYPSLVKDNLIIENVELGSIMDIYDLNGRHLWSKKICDVQYKIDVSTISSGVYLLKVNGETFKFVKE